MKLYKEKDFDWINPLVLEAASIIDRHIEENNLKDGGTCVMGAGIKMFYLKKRCRKPTLHTLIRQPFQGNNSIAMAPAVKYLLSKGVECFYDDGWMD